MSTPSRILNAAAATVFSLGCPVASMEMSGDIAPRAVAATASDPCGEIYDPNSAPNADLQRVIGSVTVKGVTVHVRIFEGADANSIASDADLDALSQQAVDGCNWPDDNSLVLGYVGFTASESKKMGGSSGRIRLRQIGLVDGAVSTAEVNTAKQHLGPRLRDKATPVQADLASFLTEINIVIPNYKAAPTKQAVPNPMPTISETPVHPSAPDTATGGQTIDFPTISQNALLGFLGTVASTGGVIYGANSLRKRNLGYKEAKSGRISTVTAIVSRLKEIDELRLQDPYVLSTINVEDQGLFAYLQEVQDVNKIYVALHTLQESLATSTVKFWSKASMAAVAEKQSSVAELMDSLPKELKEYLDARQTIQDAVDNIEAQTGKVDSLLSSIRSTAQSLMDAGWDTTQIDEAWGQFSETDGLIDSQVKDQHILEASSGAKDLIPQLTTYAATLKTLDTRFATAVNEQVKRESALLTVRSSINSLHERQQIMCDIYDPTCTKEIDAAMEVVNKLLTDLGLSIEEAAKHAGIKSIPELTAAETCAKDYAQRAGALNVARKEALKAMDALDELPGQLDKSAKSLAGRQEEFLTKARSYNTDIDPATLNELIEFGGKINQLKAELDTDKDKPKYVDLAKAFANADDHINDLCQTIESQRKAAETMRTGITEGVTSAKSDLAVVTQYIQRHGVARRYMPDIQAIVVPRVDTTGTPAGLRENLRRIKAVNASINAVYANAKQAVADEIAEQRRLEEIERRQREAAAAAAAAERQAEWDRQQAAERARQEEAARANSYTPSPSNDGGLIGGGPSNDGGLV